jgi:hypothetical protein
MAHVTGTWALTVRTPIGAIRADVTIQEVDGVLRGEAVGVAETVPMEDVRVEHASDGERLRWSQSIRKPMRLHLDFDVAVRGDELTGTSRAGRLPASAVTGRRVP